jgi:hypothetical protein
MAEHGIVAADWQWKAAADGNLGVIILPFPDVQETTNTWFLKWGSIDRFWEKSEMPGQSVYDAIDYQVCDRLFFQEEWCKGDWGVAFDDDIYFTKSTTPEAENIGWQLAETMPKEAAQHWYEVAGVQVVQMKDLRSEIIIDAGIAPESIFDGRDGAWLEFWLLANKNWNAAHPEYLCCGDLWVVVLDVKTLEAIRE